MENARTTRYGEPMIARLPSRLALAAALLLPAPACAQTTPQPAPTAAKTTDADPALWVVKDEDTTIYLFGTIHVLKAGVTWFDEGVKQAFNSADTLVLEMVQPPQAEMAQLIATKATAPAGPALPDRLSPKDRDAYKAALTGLGLPVTAFDRTDPWFAAMNLSLLPVMKLGYDPSNGPEEVLSAAAKQAGKKVIGLETAAQQIGFFDGISDPGQIAFLTSTVRDLPKIGSTLDQMVGEWSRGDDKALAETVNEGVDEIPEVRRVLLTDRNANWAKWIAERMKTPGTVFVAVGAGHLAGAGSVQDDLGAYKLKAVRVSY